MYQELLQPLGRDNFAATKESLDHYVNLLSQIMYLYKIEVNPKLQKTHSDIQMVSTDPVWLSSHLIIRALTRHWQKVIPILIIAFASISSLLPCTKAKGSKTEISISQTLTITLQR